MAQRHPGRGPTMVSFEASPAYITYEDGRDRTKRQMMGRGAATPLDTESYDCNYIAFMMFIILHSPPASYSLPAAQRIVRSMGDDAEKAKACDILLPGVTTHVYDNHTATELFKTIIGNIPSHSVMYLTVVNMNYNSNTQTTSDLDKSHTICIVRILDKYTLLHGAHSIGYITDWLKPISEYDNSTSHVPPTQQVKDLHATFGNCQFLDKDNFADKFINLFGDILYNTPNILNSFYGKYKNKKRDGSHTVMLLNIDDGWYETPPPLPPWPA